MSQATEERFLRRFIALGLFLVFAMALTYMSRVGVMGSGAPVPQCEYLLLRGSGTPLNYCHPPVEHRGIFIN